MFAPPASVSTKKPQSLRDLEKTNYESHSQSQDPLTERIIACAMIVHKELGPGLLESAYEGALAIELKEAGFSIVRGRTYPAIYKGIKVGDYRPDLIVDEEVVIEIKSVERYDPVLLRDGIRQVVL